MSTLRSLPLPSLSEVVAEEVRALMARRRMTGKQLAALLDLPESGVSARLNAKIPFRVTELEQIAGALGVHPATLLGGHSPQPTPPPTDRNVPVLGTDRNSLTSPIVGTITQQRPARVAA